MLALCTDVLRAAGEPEAEIYAREQARGFARFAVGELSQHMEVTEPLAAIRVAHGSRVAEVTSSRFDRDALIEAVRGAARVARLVPETEGFAGFAASSGQNPC